MAPLPISLYGVCNFILPVIRDRKRRYNIEIEIDLDYPIDCINIRSKNGDRYHSAVLVTRQQLDDNVWIEAVQDGLEYAIQAVLPRQSNQFADEYEDILACQAIMEQIDDGRGSS